ncbi:hypothetical protein [Nocardia gipuzkoensis]
MAYRDAITVVVEAATVRIRRGQTRGAPSDSLVAGAVFRALDGVADAAGALGVDQPRGESPAYRPDAIALPAGRHRRRIDGPCPCPRCSVLVR